MHLKPLSGQAERHQLLREYLDAGTDKLALLMRIEHRPVRFRHLTGASGTSGPCYEWALEFCSFSCSKGCCVCSQADQPAYNQLMTNHTLRLALAQKTVIEFPVILVLLQRQLPLYTVIKPGQL